MPILPLLCLAAAALLMILAVVYQWRDRIPDYGGTMGGEMTAGIMWLLASLLMAAGSYGFLHWFLSILVFLGVFALSFLIRWLVARIPKTRP